MYLEFFLHILASEVQKQLGSARVVLEERRDVVHFLGTVGTQDDPTVLLCIVQFHLFAAELLPHFVSLDAQAESGMERERERENVELWRGS